MAVTEGDINYLMRYLNNELTHQEEVMFVRRLSENEALRQAFDIELLLRSQHEQQEDEMEKSLAGTDFEPADDFLERTGAILAGALPANDVAQKKRPVAKLWNAKTIVAAASVIVVAAAFFLFVNYTRQQKQIAGKATRSLRQQEPGNLKDTPQKHLSDTTGSTSNPSYLAQLGDKHYKRLPANANVPVEISMLPLLYRQKEYKEIEKATETDYETKGNATPAKQKLLRHYMLLYKALSYIETAKPARAVPLLQSIVENEKPGESIYYLAQWYLLLATLKLNDASLANPVLADIVKDKNSPYQKAAIEIKRQFNSR